MKLLGTQIAAALLAVAGMQITANAQPQQPMLALEAKIPLGNVSGRIDHMAIDLARQRLFVAELGNNSVGVVDLQAGSVIRRIAGLKEPQGVGYVPATDTLFVANGGDGLIRLFRGADYAAAGQVELGDDADNIRVDSAANQLVVGYGSGGLAIIDLTSARKIADIRLSVHPESFQLDPGTKRIFVNLPRAQAIGVVDRQSGRQTASWSMKVAGGNFPMALVGDHVVVAFRNPSKLGVFAKTSGAVIASPDLCGDADDVFADERRHRLYVSCGQGYIDVLDTEQSTYRRIARIPTVGGARTSLFVPELERLMLAVRASPGQPAAIWTYRPVP
jgi:DNA-binding beta-propeller fold protein YncE